MPPIAVFRADCHDVKQQLSEYLDRELDCAAAAVVALHLAGCPACLREAQALAAVIAALHRLPPCPGPRG